MLEYLECEEGLAAEECCVESGLQRITSFRRKLSDVTSSSTLSPPSMSSTSSKPSKGCLKQRRSSAPSRPTFEVTPTSASAPFALRQCRGSCDSLGGSSVDLELEASTSSSAISAAGSEVGSFSSRKSVSFADSIGEDLCHIKVFMKEQHEIELQQEMSWHQRMWRWQNGYSDSSSSNNNNGDWYFGDDDDDDEAVCYYDDDTCYNSGVGATSFSRSFDAIHEVDVEEDDDDDRDSTIFMGRPLPDYSEETQQEEQETERPPPPAANTVVSATFLSPGDLPDFQSRLEASHVLLESVSVIGGSGGSNTLVSGTVALALPESSAPRSSSSSPAVSVRHSSDGWASESRAAAVVFVAGRRYGFVVDASRMRAGDDLELVVEVEAADGRNFVDDNGGSGYRLICKVNKPRFQPGKSLW